MTVSSKLIVARNAVTSKYGRQVLKLQKNSPEILFVVGVSGMVAGTVLACRATLKSREVLEKMQKEKTGADAVADLGREDYTENDHRRELAIIQVRHIARVVNLYGPSICVMVLSIGSLRRSHNILNSRNAGLMAAYALLDKGFAEYRARVLELVGPDKERELRYGSEEREIVTETKGGGKKVTHVNTVDTSKEPSIYARLFTDANQNWSENPGYNLIFLKCQMSYLNDMLQARGHVLLNEAYDFLGLERTSAGCIVGWVLGSGGDDYIDFGIFDDDKQQHFYNFVTGRERAILLDFNVDGPIWDKI